MYQSLIQEVVQGVGQKLVLDVIKEARPERRNRVKGLCFFLFGLCQKVMIVKIYFGLGKSLHR